MPEAPMFSEQKPDQIQDWTCVYESGTQYDAEMVQNYFADQDIESQILSKRDSAYNLNVGQMSMVYLYVPNEQLKQAEKALDDWKNGIINIDDIPADDKPSEGEEQD